MRNRAKHRVGCAMREELQRSGGMDVAGRLEEGMDRQRESTETRGQIKGET